MVNSMKCRRCFENSAVGLYAQAEGYDTLGQLCKECATLLEEEYDATITYGEPVELPEDEK